MIEKIVTLNNGRKYRITDTCMPYINQKQPSGGFVEEGGFVIHVWHLGNWSYISHSPSQECVDNFLKAAARLEQEKYSE